MGSTPTGGTILYTPVHQEKFASVVQQQKTRFLPGGWECNSPRRHQIFGIEAVAAQPQALTRVFEGSSPSDPTKIESSLGIRYNRRMENAETRLLQRYYRKTKAHPEGSVTHHGDCEFFSIRVCSCGLHHDLRSISPLLQQEHYPLLDEELSDFEKVREGLMHHDRKPAKKH